MIKDIKSTQILIQDISRASYYTPIAETPIIDRNRLPTNGDYVTIPSSTALKGFIFCRVHNYKVIEVRYDFVARLLLIFLRRT